MPIEILMPALSPTMSKTGGKIVRWHKKEQEKIEIGDVIAEIETDKAIMEFESIDEGILAKILVLEGTSSIPVNQLIALILKEGEDNSILDSYLSIAQDTLTVDINTISQDKAYQDDCNRIRVSPLAKKLAHNQGININKIKGTGPYGRIIKNDILEYSKNATHLITSKIDSTVTISNIRQVIAQKLTQSKHDIPHFYLTIDCQVDRLILLKNEINAEDKNNKVTINDLIIKAVACSIKQFPEINASWQGNNILKYSNIDISIAVAREDGLITPIIKHADKKGILSISQEVKDLVMKARNGQLALEEFQGGGFTISNLGMFGIKSFSAIINAPQSCIMAVGASIKQPVVINDKIAISEIMTVTLSIDHRMIDGVLGAKFLICFKKYIEHPITMLIDI
ncbi:dihydrolipoamide acetyltransferase family protein [Wolbachia endosymbiont of Howardula sp.]|uniref:dihydrolipoamide acetyltransferase family protein n=1 Tax=Wolbachia endosymbiont of Howardula sp. TaxID=2916816 RepID=UPI00217CF9FB|nr:dihydrolipoamide acetyltransferase family protein [Wolbachia endosymbiont of Howardula sp.]UWI83363.1 2-oxo acid dehydrogenase subunit E2 [Wolbachia endosymbiont of Howardula sp.]